MVVGVSEKETKIFKNYTESSKEFLAFHEQQNNIRDKEAMNKITNAKNDLKKYQLFYILFTRKCNLRTSS